MLLMKMDSYGNAPDVGLLLCADYLARLNELDIRSIGGKR